MQPAAFIRAICSTRLGSQASNRRQTGPNHVRYASTSSRNIQAKAKSDDHEPRVVHEEADFLVVHKPPALHTVPLRNVEEVEETLFKWVTERYPEVAKVEGRKKVEGGFLHRLDKPTSGLVLIGRSQQGFDRLLQQFTTNQVRKGYLAVSKVARPAPGWPSDLRADQWDTVLRGGDEFGNWSTLPMDIRLRSRFRAFGMDSSLVKVVPGNSQKIYKASKTTEDFYTSQIKLLRRGTLEETRPDGTKADASIVASYVTIANGFRHQIRCHLSYLGLPILGDEDYANYKEMREFAPLAGTRDAEAAAVAPKPFPFLLLHASFLSFYHPRNGKLLTITSQVPPRMQKVGTIELGTSE